jgi:ATP synthase F1 delta subunit
MAAEEEVVEEVVE